MENHKILFKKKIVILMIYILMENHKILFKNKYCNVYYHKLVRDLTSVVM